MRKRKSKIKNRKKGGMGELFTHIGTQFDKITKNITNTIVGKDIKAEEELVAKKREAEIEKAKVTRRAEAETARRAEATRRAEAETARRAEAEKVRIMAEEERKKKTFKGRAKNVMKTIKTAIRPKKKSNTRNIRETKIAKIDTYTQRNTAKTQIYDSIHDEYEDIKVNVNNLYYEMLDLIYEESENINKKKIRNTPLNKILTMLKNAGTDFDTNLNIARKKKTTLEESLFVLSALLKSKCGGWIMPRICSATAMTQGMSDIYKLLSDKNLQLNNLATDEEKLNYIVKSYHKNDPKDISIIRNKANIVFTKKEISLFLKELIIIVDKYINNFPQLEIKYHSIKSAWNRYKLSKGGSKKSKKNKKSKKDKKSKK